MTASVVPADSAATDTAKIGQRLKAVRRQRSGMKVVLESGIELPVGRKFRRQVAAVVNG